MKELLKGNGGLNMWLIYLLFWPLILVWKIFVWICKGIWWLLNYIVMIGFFDSLFNHKD